MAKNEMRIFTIIKKGSINIQSILLHTIEYVSLNQLLHIKTRNMVTRIKWSPPKRGYKLNCDGTYKRDLDKGGKGEVFRNEQGKWIIDYMSNQYFGNHIKANS